MGEDPSRVPCPLRSAALASPDAPVLVGAGGTVSYADFDARVLYAEERLANLGVSEGERVALYLPKDADYVVLLLALVRAGAVSCPVSTRLPAKVILPLLERAGCSVLISDDEELAGVVGPGIRALQPEMLAGEGAVGSSGLGGPRDVPLHRPATVVFTSGSTGTPKAALHTLGNHYFNALGSNENIVLAPGDRWLHSLPLYHVGGLSIIFRCLLAGAAMILPEPGVSIGGTIPGLGATHVSLVSTQLLRLLREKVDLSVDLSGLKAVLMGGGPMPDFLVDEALARGLPIHTSYGLTEMASQVTTTPPGASRERLRTSGRLLPHREVRISGDGEILVRGRTLFAGYVEGESLNRPFDAEGWFRTGDLGELDAEGYLRVVGRSDNLFVSGGENVHPEEIEAALLRLDGIEEAVVVPVPDPEFGVRPVAFVRSNGPVGDPAAALRPVLPGFKVPAAFHAWEGAGGMKPDRTALRERARTLRNEA